MESVLKNVYINKIQIPKFQGHMRLELRGCRETEVIEHDNHMTDALEKLLSPDGLWMNPGKVFNTLCPTVEKAFGGILLTDKVLEDNALLIPGGTDVTACAAYCVANADDALTQGSYNTKESVLDLPSKKMTYVYDWMTNQGNGTISAAALTNVNAGCCGYGDAGLTESTKATASGISLSGETYNQQYTISDITPCFVGENYEIAWTYANNKIILYKFCSNERTVMPFAQASNTIRSIDYIVHEEKEIEVSSSEGYTAVCNDGKYVYIAGPYYVEKDKDLYVIKIDVETLEVKKIQITNKTTSRFGPTYGIETYNGYLYFRDLDKEVLYGVNLENPADIFEIKFPKIGYLNRAMNLGNGKLFINAGSNVAVFDCEKKEIKHTKIPCANTEYQVINCSFKPAYMYSKTAFKGYSNLYLATISNLDKPVTKTADKTMKVTYTIQQE